MPISAQFLYKNALCLIAKDRDETLQLTKYEGMIERLQNQILIKIAENDESKNELQTKSEEIRALQNQFKKTNAEMRKMIRQY